MLSLLGRRCLDNPPLRVLRRPRLPALPPASITKTETRARSSNSGHKLLPTVLIADYALRARKVVFVFLSRPFAYVLDYDGFDVGYPEGRGNFYGSGGGG